MSQEHGRMATQGDERCPACGNLMVENNSRPSTFPNRYGKHPLVCMDEHACAERYSHRHEDAR